jgi:serine/threonine-protein kinase
MNFPDSLTERYHLASHLARGGMADVYVGQDTLLNRKVAVKVLHAQFSNDEAFVKRFRREAQAAANLAHPNIVGIYDWGQATDTYFIVMELVDGRSLRDVLRSEGAFLPRRAAEIGSEVAAALSAAHRAGLVHRDIKPGNILLSTDGTVKVTDFGIARAWDDSQELTRTGAVIGTATYFSPEQAQGIPADGRSDVYSLGVVLYEMLTGRPPFSGDSPVAVAYQHVSASAPPPSSLNHDVPPELDAVVTKALQKDPAFRYQTADEMRADLARVLAGQSPNVALPVLVAATVPASAEQTAATRVISAPAVTERQTRTMKTLEDRGPSQVPFIITSFGLLALLGLMVFLVFRLAAGASTPTTTTAASVAVPNVVGLTQRDALDAIQRAGFDVDIREEASEDVDSGFVIRTDPAATTNWPTGSTVVVFVSAGTEPAVVPTLVGLTEEAARAAIDEGGFELGTTILRPDDAAPVGQVIDQSPLAGVEVAPGTTINLVVSNGPEELAMPDLIRSTDDDATRILSDLDLEVQVRTESSDEFESGLVIRTNLVVSSGPPPVTVPNLLGLTIDAATNSLNAIGLAIHVVENQTVPVDDPNLDQRIALQNPSAGIQVQKGITVSVTLGSFQPPTTTTTASN